MQDLENPGKPRKVSWRNWFRRENLIVLVLSGILLFIIALPTKGHEEKDGGAAGEGLQWFETHPADTDDMKGQAEPEREGWEDYAASQEQRLKEMLTAMEGVGRVDVMLTFSSTEELVVEKETPTVRSDVRETDAAGGSRTTVTTDKGDSTVYKTAGANSEPYVVKTILPRVEGVLVVAEGAENASIKEAVTRIAEALFGVEAHKVVVVPMQTGER